MQVTESEGRLKIESLHPTGLRLFLFVFGFVPLVGPYELLIKPRWNEFGFTFAFMAMIALGAISISFFFWAAAVLGHDKTFAFSLEARECVVVRMSPFAKRTVTRYAFDAIGDVELRKIDWSEGEPSYSIEMKSAGSDRVVEKIGPFVSGPVAEKTLESLRRVLGRERA